MTFFKLTTSIDEKSHLEKIGWDLQCVMNRAGGAPPLDCVTLIILVALRKVVPKIVFGPHFEVFSWTQLVQILTSGERAYLKVQIV